MTKSSDQAERPMKRPSSAEQGVATRRAILDAAAALIAEVGWCAVTTRAIAARAGVPHGAVAYHFTGKEDLLREAAITAMAQALAAPVAMASQAPGTRELLEGTFGWYAEGGLNDPGVALLLDAAREAVRDEALRKALAGQLREYRGALSGLIARDQQRGALPPGATADGLAGVVAALLDGLMLHLALDPQLDLGAITDALGHLLGGAA